MYRLLTLDDKNRNNLGKLKKPVKKYVDDTYLPSFLSCLLLFLILTESPVSKKAKLRCTERWSAILYVHTRNNMIYTKYTVHVLTVV